jgi:protease-4
MSAFVRQVFAVLVAFAIIASVPIVFGLLLLLVPKSAIEPGTYLVISLNEPLLEHYAPPTISELVNGTPPCLMEVTENLEKAAEDDRIAGVVFDLDGFEAGLGKIDEIRAGIRRVRDSGKKTVAYAYEMTDPAIYLASECDRAVLFPKGTAYFLGFGATIEHIKGTLEKLGVREQIHRIAEYKSAAELFTSAQSSAETLANLRWILEDMTAASDSALAENLGVPKDSLAALRSRAIFRGESAVQAGLVDETLGWDELLDRLAGEGEIATVDSEDYAHVTRRDLGLEGHATIAVVHAQGFVAADGDDRFEPVVGLTLGADRVIDDLEEVSDDEDVRAVVLRWDTGGGATAGAERIAAAVSRLREKKPIVVSVADQAASGGYMMSHGANRIVCAANGITGSIGSVTGKMNIRGLLERLGVTLDDMSIAPNAFLFSPVHDYTEEQWKRLEEEHWAMYNEWTAEIARERRLTPEEIDAAARGRVWTGRQAIEHGLVDELGGFDDAVRVAKDLADLDADANVGFVHYPPKKTLLEVILEGDLERVARASVVRGAETALTQLARSSAGGLSVVRFRVGAPGTATP